MLKSNNNLTITNTKDSLSLFIGEGEFFVHINPDLQSLSFNLINNNSINVLKKYPVSTAKNGLGEEENSFKTPRGWHLIRAKIGDNAPEKAVFVGRRQTNEVFSEELRQSNPDRDWILTRIMWLSGLEIGKNRLNNVDTMRRYVYIHGGPDNDINGTPSSHGCIKMKNKDIIELFNIMPVYTKVFIGVEF